MARTNRGGRRTLEKTQRWDRTWTNKTKRRPRTRNFGLLSRSRRVVVGVYLVRGRLSCTWLSRSDDRAQPGVSVANPWKTSVKTGRPVWAAETGALSLIGTSRFSMRSVEENASARRPFRERFDGG